MMLYSHPQPSAHCISCFAMLMLCLLVFSCHSNTRSSTDNTKLAQLDKDYWIARTDQNTGKYAYYDANGHKKLGDFAMAFTDTLREYAIVADSEIVLIDRTGKVKYKVFPFDNGPDEPSEGLYRIIGDNGKIGYADAQTAQIRIPPQYECAYPFENGKAKVANQCTKKLEGDYTIWQSEKWFYIDKNSIPIK